MEFLKQVITRVNTLRTFLSSLTTRQRILAIICCVFVVDVFLLPFGLTLIFMCGTALGVWCSLQLWKRPAVFQWENVISFLPHIAKQRSLFQIENGNADDNHNGGKNHGHGPIPSFNEVHPTASRQSILQTEMSEYVRLMMRDFVVGWYRILSDDDQFSHNVFHHFKDMIKNIKHRFVKIDQKVFLCTLLHELRAHVDIFRRLQMSRSRLANKSSKLGSSAKKHSVVAIYETFAILHPALQNKEVEKEHLSQLCNALILSLLPSDVITCDTMVFLLQDILINNVFQPLVHLISDPDFLNEAFILLLMDEPLGQDHHDAETKPNRKEETAPADESEPQIKQGDNARQDETTLTRVLDKISAGTDTLSLNSESEKPCSTTQAENPSCISNNQETVHKIQNQSDDEIVEMSRMDETESVQEKVQSQSETTEPEPPKQFSFAMPMTMLEPSQAISREDPDTKSTEEGQNDETNEQMTTASLGPTVKVKTHRRSASTGSNIIAIQSAGVIDVVDEKNVTANKFTVQSRFEGMRTCFSTNCLTDLTSTQTVSSLCTDSGPSYQSTSSLSTCSSFEVSSSVPFSSKMDVQDQEETDGHQIDAGGSSASQGASPSHRNPLLRSETAPALLALTTPDTYDLHATTGGEIPLEWATWRVTNLYIPTTSWLGDPKGKKPVVYFVIKYDLLKKPTLSDNSKAEYSSQNVMEVRRRYIEFVNLHTRITNNVHLRRNMRDIGNIPKQSMLPLTRLSPAMEEQKKVSLETYLKQLLSRPVIHNSREMAEFLAIDGDGHIEFVKKASNRPIRIDKLLIHQVSGIVGTIKTILPERSPLMKLPSQQTSSSSAPTPAVLDQPSRKIQSHDQNRPMTDESQVQQQPIGGEDQWDFGGVVDTSRVRLFGLDEMKESHIQRVMKLVVSQKHEQFTQAPPSSPSPAEYDKVFLGPRSEGDGSDAPNEPHRDEVPGKAKVEMVHKGSIEAAPKDSVEVYEAIFGVMSEALLNQQSFILDQNLQASLTILIGDLVDKWLSREIGLLFTEAQWGYYLSLLRELLWPGGVWNPKDRETKTPEEMAQTKADALHELTHNAAAAVLSVILGEKHLRDGISLVLDSLQDQELNKHLLFTFLDHAMDQLVPEIHDAKFQDSLAAMP